MAKVIIYQNESGGVAVVHPSPRQLTTINASTNELWTEDDIAKKDVPTESKYKIIEESDLLSNYDFFSAWTVDEADLTDGVGL